ncbi:NAD(P)H-dependent oxidoreductase [Kitasatospora atroaurantiaca]|uniref:Glutathione-regulated potassium-efflux system ancillary protein KefG n=1 Tax=Kitasatospora atroaurantiaca TaxID=285545 RepID=A0A561EQB2_9ACTN|nr:NAD(P)H-dependent oxidoreductase [Kitasatospora atroaurantiaca]TWE17769.1 glutathione-regulated potassium-efflux system ancillary protein KefG [Kitasatospora atroaurantiaca]
MSQRTLVLLAHPTTAQSRNNTALADAVRELPNVTVHDLYAEYPDHRIDVAREQQLAEQHDRIVFQFPFYWYSTPALLKQWQDEVLLWGWAYGTEGNALRGKTLQVVTTTGGGADSYRPGGYNRFPMEHLLSPLDQMAHLTGMVLADPLILHSVRETSDEDLALFAKRYRELLEG